VGAGSRADVSAGALVGVVARTRGGVGTVFRIGSATGVGVGVDAGCWSLRLRGCTCLQKVSREHVDGRFWLYAALEHRDEIDAANDDTFVVSKISALGKC
jgi:hypothetical protein